MKIGVLSDIHIDRNAEMLSGGQSYVEIVAEKVRLEQIQLLLIAGDISNDYLTSLKFLQELEKECACKVLFVPGNHDYWSKINGITDTKLIYEKFRTDATTLLEKPCLINDDWAIVGNSGWYDHSFGNPKFSQEEFAKMTYNGRTWQDYYFVHWGMSNLEIHRWFYKKIEEDLQAVEGRKVILMTHIVTHPEFIVPMPNSVFEYFNAFIGSDEYKKLYEKYNIKVSVMGHVHYRKTLKLNDTTYICACLGNSDEWRTGDPVKEIEASFATFTI
ncbi:metallophosphoesterase [Psychrobacillus vulpis]|uniref:Phosphohydrolase n=1 Tax=Psychrobacillus vulpis TaxID=2325572 RepID=A0A544TJ79_9BACI|nr:metallophosphoesterase [Psychrobacillus vulpis]TQR17514.1 phosphohydrolase [Psychrobacillus vulpis]